MGRKGRGTLLHNKWKARRKDRQRKNKKYSDLQTGLENQKQVATQGRRIISPPTNPDIFIISLGCPRNLVDSEILIGGLKKQGFRIIYEFKKHCIAIVNTCGFIEDAKKESINIILELADLKKAGKLKRLIVTGCLSQRYSTELLKEIEGIDGIFGCSTFYKIPEYIKRILSGEKPLMVDRRPNFLYNHQTPRLLMTPRHSVYVKIQEGCMNFCSYCVIPKIRGPYRSRGMESLLKEVSSFNRSGVKEINLIGQDTTLYGIDKYKRLMLSTLLEKMSKLMKGGWIRLLYTHPAHYNKDLINVIKNEAPICKYLDLPIQHINDKILKRMNRRITKRGIINLIENLRKNIPNVAIRTSIIVGFPGETDKEFNELENFVEEIRFDRLGVFIYSKEEETKAFDFKGHIPEQEKEQRFKKIMEAQKKISSENNKAYLDKRIKTLIDEKDTSQRGQYIGRTQHDAPEVDGTVYVKSKRILKEGDFVDVKIEDVLEYDLVGSV